MSLRPNGNSWTTKATGLTQAGGAEDIDVKGSYLDGPKVLTSWQITVEPSGTPSAGTLTVAVKAPGASQFVDLATTISMTAATNERFEALADEIRVTPTGFDGTSYDVILNAYAKGE